MLSDFKTLDLHDTPIKSIKILFDIGKIELIVSHFSDVKDDYFDIQIYFSDVSDFHVQDLKDIWIYEMSDFEVTSHTDNHFVEFLMLSEEPRLERRMSFYFKNINVSYPFDCEPRRTN